MILDLKARAAAAQATRRAIETKPWKLSRNDCFVMLRAHLVRMGCAVPEFGNVGAYHTPVGARRKLVRAGYPDLLAAMDAHFARIPPASAWLGDVIALEGEEGIGALTIYVGNGRVCGFHQDCETGCVMQPEAYVAAWGIGR